MRVAIRLTVIALCVLGVSMAAMAEVPKLINYQGILIDPGTGEPIAGSTPVIISLYHGGTEAGGGVLVYAENPTLTTDADGLFNHLIGSLASNTDPEHSLTPDDFVASPPESTNPAWLELAISRVPLLPRSQLVTVGYSMATGTVNGATGGNITGKVAIGTGHTYTGSNTFVAGMNNTVSGDYSAVGGGLANVASGGNSTISGGSNNTAAGGNAAVAGGTENHANNSYSAIGGGSFNTSTGMHNTIGGGGNNGTNGEYSTIGGGENEATGKRSAIGGGWHNMADGFCGTVCGGYDNEAAGFAFAGGYRAKATHSGAFVWADNSINANFSSERPGQFRMRALGGFKVDNGSRWFDFRDTGTDVITTSTGAHLTIGGVWANSSDVNLKENFSPVDREKLLERIAALTIDEWNYRAEKDDVRHIGPTAQEFYASFRLGTDDKSISTIDPAGIALAAIQGLYQQNQAQQKEITELKTLVARLLAERQ